MGLKDLFNFGSNTNQKNVDSESATPKKKIESIKKHYKEVYLQEKPNDITFFKWYDSFLNNPELRKVVHNVNIVYGGAGALLLHESGYDAAIHYLKNKEKLVYAFPCGIPITPDGYIDEEEYNSTMDDFQYDPSAFGINIWERVDNFESLDNLRNTISNLGYDIENISEMVVEFLKYDYCMAMYHKYKDVYHEGDNLEEAKANVYKLDPHYFTENFAYINFEDLIIHEDYGCSINYGIMAFYAFRINDLGDKFDFNSLENLFFKAREINIQQTKEVNEFLLTRDNDVNDFSNVHPATVDGLIPDEKTIPSSNIDTISPYDLEKLVEQAYLNLGYEAIATKKSGDQGADVVVKNPDTELITVIQVKQYSAKVGNKAVQEIIAGKAFYNANEAIVMTNNYFTESAVTLAENTGVILFDREKFMNFLDKAYKN